MIRSVLKFRLTRISRIRAQGDWRPIGILFGNTGSLFVLAALAVFNDFGLNQISETKCTDAS